MPADAQAKQDPPSWDGSYVVGSMWDSKSPLSPAYRGLYDELVPDRGMCETTRGEAVRAISKLYYDAYNNGGCNHHNYDENINFLDQFLEKWLTNDGPVTVVPVLDAMRVVRRSWRGAERIEQRYEEWERSDGHPLDEPQGWDALKDDPYLDAIELLAHWITWKVARLNDGYIPKKD